MSRIVPKLNLNKTPQLVENNSLVMAKNIRLLEDGTIGPDTSLEEIETKLGNATQNTIHHDAVTETLTDYRYTILDCDTTINYVRDGNSPDEQHLEDVAFDFIDYGPNGGRNSQDDTNKYVEVSSVNQCNIYVYRIDNEELIWSRELFTYNPNEVSLITNGGYCLVLGVRQDIYNEDPDPPVGIIDYFYAAVPKLLLNHYVSVRKYNYFLINPVYPTSETETITIAQAYDEVVTHYDTLRYIGQIVGLNNKIYFFKEELSVQYSEENRGSIAKYYPNELFVGETPGSGQIVTFDINDDNYVTRRGELFEDRQVAEDITPLFTNRVRIYEFDEITKEFKLVKCGWRYSGGKITGCVTVNSTGEPILSICEYDVPNNKLVPIKHINLKKCRLSDNESHYTQAPNIPISNLNCVNRYVKNIPAGVYQFFIRYKIHDGFYTNWFPCSKELYAGSKKKIDTLQGTIKYVDLHEDSNHSFVFNIEHLFTNYCSKFEQYQLGFIVSSDGGSFARSWKHFDMVTTQSDNIYFEYNNEDIEEINIDDLLNTTYDIFNVANITPYKNKLYISNYRETDFNENLESYAKQVNVELRLKEIDITEGYDYYFASQPLIESEDYQNIYDKYGINDIKFTFRSNMYCDRILNTDYPHTYRYIEVLEENFNSDDWYNRITNVYLIYNNVRYDIIGGDSDIENIPVVYLDNNLILNTVSDYIREKIIGITSSGVYKARLSNNGSYQNVDLIEYFVEYTHYDYPAFPQQFDSGDPGYPYYTAYPIDEDHYKISETVNLKDNIITTQFEYNYNDYNTLLPFTKYDFYIHYVKQNGIVTNGYLIGTKEVVRYCKGYKEIDRSYGDEILVDSIDNLNDLCICDANSPVGLAYDDNGTIRYFRLYEVDNNKCVIYPYFSNIIKPDGYVSCFISISKHGNSVAEGFNYQCDTKATHHILDCLELDCLLYNQLEHIEIWDSRGTRITANAKYFSSTSVISDQNPSPLHLGCSGHVEFDTADTTTITTKLWIIFNSVNRPYNKTLTKITPYIKLDNDPVMYDNYLDVNTPGHFCFIMKLNRDYCDAMYFDPDQSSITYGSYVENPHGYYVSGTDIYTRSFSGTDINVEDVTTMVNYNTSNLNYIHSNFNLNYVSLTKDLIPSIRRYNVDETVNPPTSDKQFITTVDSLICSFILELKSTYRDYTKKLYYEYNKHNITKFDNTIRVSSIDVDEIYRYIYRFGATDYYHVPTQRGIITNLFAIANSVYVHCEHSLFKFSDNKTLNAQDEEVTLQENDIFNSGISEVFDAQYGYAGLKTREHSLVTYNAYVFYDDVARTIYAFGGEQQIGSISESIKKVIDAINPTDVRFLGDELHNRFFVNLYNKNGNVCLSFNFNSKSFISVHDFDFDFGFHSRRHTYLIHQNIYDGYPMGWSIYRITDLIKILTTRSDTPIIPDPTSQSYTKNYIAYQNCYKRSLIHVPDCDDLILFNEVKSANACVDVIVNTEYEAIKVLNYFNWICSEIISYGENENNISEEILDRYYPGTKIKIYSDSTEMSLFDLLDIDGNPKIANENRNIDSNGNLKPNPRNWQYPEYNCGVWSMNYFRDVKHSIMNDPNTDIFEYTDGDNHIGGNPGDSQTTDLTPKSTRQHLTQENSLLYGKYFVVRFIFNNKNFKLENISLKMNDYEKTK